MRLEEVVPVPKDVAISRAREFLEIKKLNYKYLKDSIIVESLEKFFLDFEKFDNKTSIFATLDEKHKNFFQEIVNHIRGEEKREIKREEIQIVSPLVAEGVRELKRYIDLNNPIPYEDAYNLANELLGKKYLAKIEISREEFDREYERAISRWVLELEKEIEIDEEKKSRILPYEVHECPQCGKRLIKINVMEDGVLKDAYKCLECLNIYRKGD